MITLKKMGYFDVFLSLTLAQFGVITATVAIVLFSWYWFAYRPYQFFKVLGIPHPPVLPFVGNSVQLRLKGRLACYDKWIKQYGKVCGYYWGATPHFLITDLDMVKDIMVKYSEIFMDRLLEGAELMECLRVNQLGLITLKGEPWKRARRIISPTFSVSKVKQMIPLVETCCDNLVKKFLDIAKSGQTVDIANVYGKFAMSTVIAAAFGREVNILKGEADELTDASYELVTNYNGRRGALMWPVVISSHFPFLMPVFQFIVRRTRAAELSKIITGTVLQIIQARRLENRPSKYKDFLQLVIEAYDEEDKNSTNGKVLHDNEIVGQCLELLFAGYETTGNNLGFMAYLLATNPDKQEKLHQAIDEYYQENENATLHEASEAIPYLDWVCQEALRLYAGVPRFSRYCRETVSIKGVTIPKGSVVSIAIQWLHYSPEHWEDPESFRPERFSPEEKEGRPAMCYLPFGVGPRHCVATKFAVMEVRMGVLAVMRHTKFVKAPETEVPKIYATVTQGAVNGVHLKIETR